MKTEQMQKHKNGIEARLVSSNKGLKTSNIAFPK